MRATWWDDTSGFISPRVEETTLERGWPSVEGEGGGMKKLDSGMTGEGEGLEEVDVEGEVRPPPVEVEEEEVEVVEGGETFIISESITVSPPIPGRTKFLRRERDVIYTEIHWCKRGMVEKEQG